MSRKKRSTKAKPLRAARRLFVTISRAGATLLIIARLAVVWARWSYNGPGPAAKGGPGPL